MNGGAAPAAGLCYQSLKRKASYRRVQAPKLEPWCWWNHYGNTLWQDTIFMLVLFWSCCKLVLFLHLVQHLFQGQIPAFVFMPQIRSLLHSGLCCFSFCVRPLISLELGNPSGERGAEAHLHPEPRGHWPTDRCVIAPSHPAGDRRKKKGEGIQDCSH